MSVPTPRAETSAYAVLFFALLVLTPSARAQADGEGWRSLFNGEDLSGWQQLNGAHVFEARDGMIVGSTVPGEPNGFLVTEEEFGDFVLELEVLVDPLMNNSGIQFRSLSRADYQNYRVHGYQAEIDTKPQRWSGSIYDEARRGWLYVMELNPDAKPAFVNNTWNHYRIEAVGSTLRTWVNGVPAAHLVDDETARGFIGLQLHANNPDDPPGSHQIRFRNIRIMTESFEPSPFDDVFVVNLIPNTVSAQERAQGFALLWDGRTSNGWSGLDGGDFPDAAWSLERGELNARGERKADIATEQRFGAFELKFEFRALREDATCAVRYLVDAPEDEPSQYCQMASRKLRAEGWNQSVIRSRTDGHVEYWLNGHKILEYLRAGSSPDEGHIVLEHDPDGAAYRSIKIRELD